MHCIPTMTMMMLMHDLRCQPHDDSLGDGSTQALLEKYLTLHPGKHVLLDGFPRSLDNARDWARLFGPPEACIR